MITPISPKAFAPSFGMAQLTEKGKEIASSNSMDPNNFLDGKLFDRPRFLSSAQITGALRDESTSFSQICQDYGCSKNPRTNAEFINNQIISKKGQKAISKQGITPEELKVGFSKLLSANYDNIYLSKESCEELLDMAKDYISTDVYTVYAGIFRDSK